MSKVPVITIDGLSGAGRGTVSKMLCNELGWNILDSGALYRTLTFLIEKKEINKAQLELSKLHTKYKKDPNYLLLRSKIFYINKLYYLAIDTLFIALEFDKKDQIYLPE